MRKYEPLIPRSCFPLSTQPGNDAKHEPQQADYKCARDVFPENVLRIVGVSAVQPGSRSLSSCSAHSLHCISYNQ